MRTSTKIVSYNIDNEFQCCTGEVVKEGSKRIFIRERNVPNPDIIPLDIRENNVIYLLGSKNKFFYKIKGNKRRK